MSSVIKGMHEARLLEDVSGIAKMYYKIRLLWQSAVGGVHFARAVISLGMGYCEVCSQDSTSREQNTVKGKYQV